MPETIVTGGLSPFGCLYPGSFSNSGAPVQVDRLPPARAALHQPCTCGTPRVRDGACSFCPSCGWSSCSG